MKNVLFFLWSLLPFSLLAQADGFLYTALIKDNNLPYANQNVELRFSFYLNFNMPPVYQETHTLTTDHAGIVHAVIGQGNVIGGDFSSLSWDIDYIVKVEMDTDGNGFVFQHQFGFQSLPYAHYAESGGNKRLNDLYDAVTDNMSVYLGESSGYWDMGANKNTAVGLWALSNNSSGEFNTAAGYESLAYNDGGSYNTGIGYHALYSNTSGDDNTAFGSEALVFNTTGYSNTAFGYKALFFNATGYYNTAVGYKALYSNLNGYSNTALGAMALYANGTGKYNTAVGFKALYNNANGSYNTAVGNEALFSNVSGNNNTAAGYKALYNNTGSDNTAAGNEALYQNTSGWGNTAVGYRAGYNGTTYFNRTAIGYNAQNTASNQVRVGNASVTSIGGFANWSNVSDGRFKTGVKENVPGMALVEKLNPVTYHLNVDKINDALRIPEKMRDKESMQKKQNERQIGFIAQEVEQAARELGFDFHAVDKPKTPEDFYGLRYDEFVPVLTKAVQELYRENVSLDNANKQNTARIEALKQKLVSLTERINNLKR